MLGVSNPSVEGRVMSKCCLRIIWLVFACFFGNMHAQENVLISKEIKPSLGLGVGFLNYYGDVNSIGNQSSLMNQFAYEVFIARKINSYSDLGFSFLTGTMIGNERSVDRNLNFRTDIYSVSVYGNINLGHWLNWSDVLNPYITFGFESFEYNSKGDLVDENGTLYHYWSDGTIRDINQQSPQASQASIMYRDYKYETDLRAANLDGFGTYPQLAIAIPVGIGVNMAISDRLSFKVGSTFHYTFTDLIDNVSKNGEGVRKGNPLNDYFTFNSVSLHYDLLSAPPKVDRTEFSFPDYFSVDGEDEDGDGVLDGIDLCPYTPLGVDVDIYGCPIDDDQDGVPNYLDQEAKTPPSSFVNAYGETLTDEDFYQQYLRYVDSAEIPIEILHKIAGEPEKARQYRVLLGEYAGDITEDLAKKFLAEDDIVGVLNKRNQTAYLSKKYVLLQEAKDRKEALTKKGFKNSTIVVWEGDEYFSLPQWDKKSKKELKQRFEEYFTNKEQLEGMLGIKLGETEASANSKDKMKFFDYEDVVVLKGDSGKSDYVIGPFIDQVGAKQALEKVDRTKYPMAEVVKVENQRTESIGIEINDVESSNPVGSEVWNQSRKKEEGKTTTLKGLENNYVLDFGLKNNPNTQKDLNKIKSRIEVEEVTTKEGEVRIISKRPQSETTVAQTAKEFHDQAINVTVKKVKNGEMFPVDISRLLQTQTAPRTTKMGAETLAELNGGYTIDVGKTNDPIVEKSLKSIGKIIAVDSVETKNGTTRIVASENQTLDEAVKKISQLKKLGITPQLVEVKNGDLIPVDHLSPSKESEVLKEKNGLFAIKFGNPSDSVVKGVRSTIEQKMDVVEVITRSGESQLISTPITSKEDAEKIVEQMKLSQIDASVVQIENGELNPVGGSIQIPKSGDGPLEKYVINLGKTTDPEKEAIKKNILKETGAKEITTAQGETILVTDETLTQSEANLIAESVKSKGIDAKVGTMNGDEFVESTSSKDGEVNLSATSLPIDSSLTYPLENSFVVSLGTIDQTTSNEEKEKLENAPNTIKIDNTDGTIDVLSNQPHKTEQEAYKEKSEQNKQGFTDAKVAFFKDGKPKVIRKEELDGKYSVSMGSFKTDVSNEEVNKILSVPDVESIETTNPNMTTYVQGSYDSPGEAKSKMEELLKKGLEPSLVKVENGAIKEIAIESVFDSETIQKLAELSDEADLIKTDDILYRVQLGAYRQKINKNIFRGVNTLSFPTSGGITKYVTGSYASYQQAYISKLELRRMGFKGAFVVAYKDGRRIKVTDLVNKERFEQIKETVKPIENSTTSTFLPEDVSNSDRKENPSESEVDYKVQVGAYKDGEEPAGLSQFEEMEMEVYGQYKRYLTGGFKTYADAEAYKQEVKSKGFPEAFVVAYNNGQRVVAPGEESNVITKDDLTSTKSTNSNAQYELSKVLIMVQVGLFKGDIPEDLKGKFAGLPNLTKQVTAHGVTRYMTGSFKNISEAAAFKEELLKTGFPDAFLVAYYENDRVKLSDMVEILKSAQ